jgi:predicted ribosome quality control (RQC) complex YloA/Tae2 family protein
VPPAPSGDLDPFSGEMAAELDAIERRRRSEWETLLRARLVGVSPFLAKELASRGEHTSLREACSRAFGRAARAEWRAVLVGDGRGGIAGAYPIELECRPASEQSMARSVNDALDRAYGARLERGALESARREALSRISAALSVRSSRLEDARKAEAGGAEADRLSMIADLLLAYGGGQDPAQGYAEVPDPCADDATMRISLDGSQSVPANAEARYARARRLRSAQRWGAAEAPRLEREIAALSEARDRLAEATNCDGVEAAAAGVAHMLRSAPAPGAREGVTHGAETPAGVRRMVGPGGWVILMGQNAEGNDRMLRTMCAPDDLWFHVRAHTSAHVVVRNPARRQAVPDHVIAAAALLAAQNSKAKHSSCVAVDYTQCKHVRRPRKAAHGAVTYSHEKTIHVSPGR